MLVSGYWMLDELKAQSLPAFGGLKAERNQGSGLRAQG